MFAEKGGFDLVVGNPPWVKWSNMPTSYADFIKPMCRRLNVFSDDIWVGGIESDISTVITYHALERFVKKGGRLAFLITGTVLKNESSQGFRRWTLPSADAEDGEKLHVYLVEDYKELKPFDGVSNWPVLLCINRNETGTSYPVPYIEYKKDNMHKENEAIICVERYAQPVPGVSGGPWLVGTKENIYSWNMIFRKPDDNNPYYTARKGVTTDKNGLFFVTTEPINRPNFIKISNNPKLGRDKRIVQRTATIETDYVFPLLRGRNINRFHVERPVNQGIVVPQTGMNGDESLPIHQHDHLFP